MVDRKKKEINKSEFLVISLVLIILGFMVFVFANTTMTVPVANGNYSDTLNISIIVDGNGANNMTNVTCYYNASGGTATNWFVEILNTSVDATIFENASISTSGSGLGGDSTTYNLSCNIYNGTTLNKTISRANITIDTISPQINITYPLNTTCTTQTISFNISSNENLGFCKVSIDNWATNWTMTLNGSLTGANYTKSFVSNGNYLAKFWCNDSVGNINNTEEVNFTLNSPSWDFYGYTYDVNGNSLNNTLVNITLWTMSGGPPSLADSISTNSNESGWFNLTVLSNSNWFYKPVITHANSTTNAIDYIGQCLPQFPFAEFNSTTDINFYLRDAGTINLTAINRTGGRTNFMYQVKDTKLGYPIAENFASYVSEANIYVPRDRNYSVMVYPQQSLPVSFDWNNFTSNASYEFGQEHPTTNLSSYNVTTHTVHKQFNCTESLIRVTGYIQNSSNHDFADWNEFTVIPILLEPGNMVYLSNDVGMPYNMSAWNQPAQTDEYNLTSGWYNITLPGPAESATYILFATARNGSNYYGSFRNITLGYNSSDEIGFNFTMYGLMSSDWGTVNSNITLKNVGDSWAEINISTAKQKFNLVNSTNSTLTNVNAHLEMVVDYSNYDCMEFTFMTDLSSGNASFYIPLINATGVKEINVFAMGGPSGGDAGGSYAPKRASMTVAELKANNNITLSVWEPGGLGGTISEENIFIKFYISNETCDTPNPDDSCKMGDFGPDDGTGRQARENFNPLSLIIGGGKLSFRMGYGDIEIHYVNVDMLASGPPDIGFDDSATTSTSGSFESALRFGSMGPTIYDYVLVSIPYTPGSTSTTGLNENADVNMSIPLFYTGDDVDTLIWDVDNNGTSATALAGNYSHYSAHQSEWGILMNQSNCTRNVSEFNSTNPCYLDTTNNQIWIRLPHFDGNEPSVTGNVITAATTTPPTTSSGGGSSRNVTTTWTSTYVYDDKEFSEKEPLTREFAKKARVRLKIGGESHYVGVKEITETTATIEVSSEPVEATLAVGDTRRFDVTDDDYYDVAVTLNSITENKANIKIISIYEEVTEETIAEEQEKEEVTKEGEEGAEEKDLTWLWILIGVLVLVAVIGAGIAVKRDRTK